MEPSCIMNILPCCIVYPHDRIGMIEWLCVVNRPSVEVEWLIDAHVRAPSHNGGSMCTTGKQGIFLSLFIFHGTEEFSSIIFLGT
jgi:hypothetical protein